MPTPTKGARLGGSASHQRIILANLATQLFEHGKIVTTEAKARRLRPLAEKLITKAKRGDIHARRSVLTTVLDKGVVHVLFTEIAPTFEGRDGGYLRITKVGPRKGDNAPMAQIELVTESVEDSRKANAKTPVAAKKATTRGAAKRTSSSPVAAAGAEPGPDGPAGAGAEEQFALGEPVEQAPAEELVEHTEERDAETSVEQEPSDDINAEEAAASESVEGETRP